MKGLERERQGVPLLKREALMQHIKDNTARTADLQKIVMEAVRDTSSEPSELALAAMDLLDRRQNMGLVRSRPKR
jgi:hypothetical protein